MCSYGGVGAATGKQMRNNPMKEETTEVSKGNNTTNQVFAWRKNCCHWTSFLSSLLNSNKYNENQNIYENQSKQRTRI